jgi:hypothetical protein
MLERPSTPPRVERRPRRTRQEVVGTLPVAAVTAALWAAAIGLVTIGVLVTIVWAVSARGDDGVVTPVAAAGVVWLVAHHAPVDTATGTVTLLPMLLLVLPLVLLQRAGRWAARVTATTDPADAGLIVVAAAAAYTALAFLVGQGASLGGATVSPLAALVWPALVAVVGLGAGVVDGASLRPVLLDQVPPVLRRAGRAAAVAGTGLVAVSVLVAIVAVATRWSSVQSLGSTIAHGAGDVVGLVLVSLAYLPNLLVWTLSFVVGPGFGVGAGQSVSAFSAGGALLPGMPLLGAIPADSPAAAPLLLLLPVACGIAASVWLRRSERLSLVDEVVALVAAATIVGVATVVLCWLSGGSLGGGRLTGLGPPALLTGLATFGFVAGGAVLASLVVRLTPTIWVTGHHHDAAE